MADDEDKDSKTEAPSEKKLRDAAEKGNTPVCTRNPGVRLPTIAIYVFLVFFLPGRSILRIAETLRDLFRAARGVGPGDQR